MSLHTEAFTIVAKAYGGVQELTDIPGRRVNIGNPGSGQRATMELLMRVMGWTAGDFRAVFELPTNRQATVFCEGHFDVMVHVVGHPSETVRDAVRGCKGRVVNVRGAKINRLVDELPYYTRVRIPAGTYYGNVHDIQTFGSYATLVTTKFVPADTVHKVVNGIVANLEKLKTMHPAAVSIGRAGLFKDGLTAPLHDGVERYLRELGRW